ncbi:hypothetical protein [Bacillus paranthracis]|uniref:hypothetical protein n=1 Tax=Bacillus paranthracis TaxID=2026186 RepID=UPI001E305BF3|nr:hypothetical protein [Bacillus paranthracis]MCC2536567.1 hypothetical protein [Bacillus paranthracis]
MKTIFKDGNMQNILTLQEFVHLKGTENQIKKFNDNGRLPTNQLKAILTRYEEEYEKVDSEGRGQNKIFILSNKRAEPIKIAHVGKGTNTKSPMVDPLMTLVVMGMIEHNHNYKGCFHYPVSKIMDEYQIANQRFCYYRSGRNLNHHLIELEEKANIHKNVSTDVLRNLHSSFSSAIFGVFRKLEKMKLAKWYKLPYALYYKTEVKQTSEGTALEIDGEVEVETIEEWRAPLDIEIAKEIDDKVKLLEEKLGMNYWTAKNSHHLSAQQFIQEYKKIHAFYSIRYKYDAYCAYLTKTETKIREIIELPNTPEQAKLIFDIVAKQYNLKLAEGRQKKVDGFGAALCEVKQAKLNGAYLDNTETVYDYMIDGYDLQESPNNEK